MDNFLKSPSKSDHSCAQANSKGNPFLHKIHFDELSTPKKTFLWRYIKEGKLNVVDEQDVSNHIQNMMREIIQMIPQFEGLDVDIIPRKRNGQNKVPDLFCIRACNTPFFVIEVKKPGIWQEKRTTALEHIYGQMFDYLLSLQEDHGYVNPYGMLCTYEETQICWLENAHTKRSQSGRSLNVSEKIYHFEDHLTKIEAIANALILGYESLVKHQLRNEFGYVSVFKSDTMGWDKLECKELHLRYELPSQETIEEKGLFLLNTFAKGAEGKAYHVCDASGLQCVIKRYSSQTPNLETVMQNEIRFWKDFNHITISSVKINGNYALLMPYLVPLEEDEIKQFVKSGSSINVQVNELITSFVDSGWRQIDASWRHIGWFQDETKVEERKLKLFDFGHVQSVKKEEKHKSIQKMLDLLHAEVDDLFRPPHGTGTRTLRPRPKPILYSESLRRPHEKNGGVSSPLEHKQLRSSRNKQDLEVVRHNLQALSFSSQADENNGSSESINDEDEITNQP